MYITEDSAQAWIRHLDDAKSRRLAGNLVVPWSAWGLSEDSGAAQKPGLPLRRFRRDPEPSFAPRNLWASLRRL